MKASGLGVLANEGLSFETEEEQEDWKGVVERSIVLMENVVRNVTRVDQTIDQFEDLVFSGPQDADLEEEPVDITRSPHGFSRRNSTLGLGLDTRGLSGMGSG